MDPRTGKRLVALLAAEIEQAARRILTRDDDVDIEEILAHVELQISFMREARYRSAPLQVRPPQDRARSPKDPQPLGSMRSMAQAKARCEQHHQSQA